MFRKSAQHLLLRHNRFAAVNPKNSEIQTSFVMPTTEALSDTERNKLRTSVLIVLALVSVIGISLAPLVYVLFYDTDTLGEFIFTASMILLALLVMFALFRFSSASRRDMKAGVKHVTRGRISQIDHKLISSGMLYYVWVDQTLASDPLIHTAAAPLGTLSVGQPVEIAKLPQSGRTLYVRPLS